MTLLNAKEDQAKIVTKIADCKTIEVLREKQDAAMDDLSNAYKKAAAEFSTS